VAEPLPAKVNSTIDTRYMRQVLGHAPTSVAVVCTLAEGQPAGCTVGSFISVSVDPPLIAFFGMRTSATCAAIVRSGSFTVNILAADQARMCDLFARERSDRFAHAGWTAGRQGNPRLHGAVAVLDCDVESVTPTGDHEMVTGYVRDLLVARTDADPLIFVRGALRKLAPIVVPRQGANSRGSAPAPARPTRSSYHRPRRRASR
jgi:3-hydroxy-9,10-secoandrosta-1,3,5(10)-triene-9,17-dione monooxygenase reductase component